MNTINRRQLLGLAMSTPLMPLVSGCRASFPSRPVPQSSHEALALLNESATAHGLATYLTMEDLNVSYSGHWRWLVGKLQPALVDSGFRGGSEERLLLRDGIVAQSHVGPHGHKQVSSMGAANDGVRVHVWFNGKEAQDRDQIDAAGLVVDAYSLFLLGPMLLAANQKPHRDIQADLAGAAEVTQGKRTFICDVINLRLRRGFGNADADQVAMYLDRETRLMRRVRMSINGLESTRGALIDVDTFEHRQLHGVFWPTAFHERLLRPAPLDVHEWRLTGLDINRGETQAELTGPVFTGKALPSAKPLPTA
jgi:hypothetical protein